MIFDRREWLAIITAGIVKLLWSATTIQFGPRSTLPVEEDDSSTSVISSGSGNVHTCDCCGNHFSISALRYYPIKGDPKPWTQLCNGCHDLVMSRQQNPAWGTKWLQD